MVASLSLRTDQSLWEKHTVLSRSLKFIYILITPVEPPENIHCLYPLVHHAHHNLTTAILLRLEWRVAWKKT
jgi:hypothetical protein